MGVCLKGKVNLTWDVRTRDARLARDVGDAALRSLGCMLETNGSVDCVRCQGGRCYVRHQEAY